MSEEELSNLESDYEQESETDSLFDFETPAEKRIRLAKDYLENVKKDLGNEHEVDASELDKELIANRLRNDVLETKGKLFKKVASEYDFGQSEILYKLKGHQLPITCVVVSSNGKWLFTSSKDGSFIQCKDEIQQLGDILTGTKIWKVDKAKKGSRNITDKHTDHILCLAVSADNNYLATGGRDKMIHIWSINEKKHLKCFKHHKDAVTGLVFRKGANQLYSASLDRTLAVWNIDNLSYIESLYGHQDCISAVDSLSRERCVSIGQRDRSARLWKIMEESQLVFNQVDESGGCFDAISLIDEDNFVTGSDTGTITLWNVNKKKQVFSHNTGSEILILKSFPYTDLFASGSDNGEVSFWKLGDNLKTFEKIGAIKISGFINSIDFSEDGSVMAVGTGRENRLGRWKVDKTVSNSIYIVKLK